MKKILLVLSCAFLAVNADAQSIFSNAITGTNPNSSDPYTIGQSIALNLSVSGIGRGAGITGSNANDRYSATTWGTTLTEAAAITGDKYFTFTLTPSAGFEIDFSSLSFIAQGSGTGPHSFAVFSSIGGFTVGNELFSFTQPGTVAYTTATQNVDLSGLSLQNIAAPIEFRIYAWNAGATGGTFSINNFDFAGTITAVPEPHTYGVAIAALLGVVVMIRRRQNAQMVS